MTRQPTLLPASKVKPHNGHNELWLWMPPIGRVFAFGHVLHHFGFEVSQGFLRPLDVLQSLREEAFLHNSIRLAIMAQIMIRKMLFGFCRKGLHNAQKGRTKKIEVKVQ